MYGGVLLYPGLFCITLQFMPPPVPYGHPLSLPQALRMDLALS